MSGLAAILNLDGRPVQDREMERMLEAIAHRGPEGFRIWQDGPISLGHRNFQTTPESLNEIQPHSDETGRYRLVFDGRIDNAAELGSALEPHDFRLRSDSDAELILRSFQCWGESFVERLLGDFALAIWDAQSKTLLCARDALGVKPLYYYFDGRIFVCGSETNALLSHSAIPLRPNEGMIGEFLAVFRPTGTETLIRSIMRLRPGHFMIVRSAGISTKRYFDLDVRKEIRYGADQEYADHFLEIFKEAVRCRMRSTRPVAMQLSGGLDSSSIVCTASAFFRRSGANCPSFETYSLTFPGFSGDESPYVDAVVKDTGVRSNIFTPSRPDEFDNFEWVRKFSDFPEYPNNVSMLRLSNAAKNKGSRVLLTGLGGDEYFSGCQDDLADLFRNFRFLSLIRQIRIDSGQSTVRIGKKIGALHIFLANGVLPLLPRRIQRLVHRIAGHKQSFPAWVDAEFARRISLEDRLNPAPPKKESMSVARRDFFNFMHSGDFFVNVDEAEHSFMRNGLEARHPFLDRRILEFAWAIPEDQCRRFGEERVVVRNAMRGILPEKIRSKFSKASFNQPFLEAIKFYGEKINWNDLDVARRGWVNPEALKIEYSNLVKSVEQGVLPYSGRTWMAIAMEIWHNVVFGGSLSKEICD